MIFTGSVPPMTENKMYNSDEIVRVDTNVACRHYVAVFSSHCVNTEILFLSWHS